MIQKLRLNCDSVTLKNCCASELIEKIWFFLAEEFDQIIIRLKKETVNKFVLVEILGPYAIKLIYEDYHQD